MRVFSLLATSFSVVSAATCYLENGVDYVGNDLSSVSASAASDCCTKCSAVPECGAFTWTDWNGGTCWLKRSKETVVSKNGAQSAEVRSSSSPSCTIQVGVDFSGNDIGNTPGATANDCCAKCAARSGCGAFSWTDYNGGTCWLKSSKGATTVNPNVSSCVMPTKTCPNVETSVDYNGNDIGSVAGSGASDCCTKCANKAGCGAFTWTNWNGGTCWLKSSKGSTSYSFGSVSAVLSYSDSTVSTDKCPTIEQGIDYVGNDIGNVSGTDATVCCTKCGQTAGCGAFTWTNWNGGTCWLKSQKGSTKVTTGAVSAVWNGTPSPTTPAPTTPVPTTPTPTTPVPTTPRPTTPAPTTPTPTTPAPTTPAPTTPTPTTPVPTTPAPGPSKCSTLEYQINYVGNDIGHAASVNATGCCDKCASFTGCNAFTWSDYDSGTCWFKSGKGQTSLQMGVYSGTLNGAPTPAPTTFRPIPPRPTTTAPLPSNHVQWKLRAGVIPTRAVNIGGWLVGEYWMSKASPMWKGVTESIANEGEYLTMQALGKEVGTLQFEEHRKTWITEADIQEIASFGLNTVRVPVGFWILDDDPKHTPTNISSVYANGSLKYLDTLINDWAIKHNVAVLISLHCHVGSQNGFDNSAPQVFGARDWTKSQANINNSLAFASFIADRYKDKEAFLGMNLVNEPGRPAPYSILYDYYLEAYKRIRATGNDCILVTSPLYEDQGPDVMQDFMPKPAYQNVWHEWHPYWKWGYEGFQEEAIIESAKGYRQAIDRWNGNPLIISEWSLGTFPQWAPFTNRTLQSEFANVQLQNYEAAFAGWAFWAWRNDEELEAVPNGFHTGWSMRQLLRDGVFKVPKV